MQSSKSILVVGILKNAVQPRLPDGFFDSENKNSVVEHTVVSNKTEPMEEEETEIEMEGEEDKGTPQTAVSYTHLDVYKRQYNLLYL